MGSGAVVARLVVFYLTAPGKRDSLIQPVLHIAKSHKVLSTAEISHYPEAAYHAVILEHIAKAELKHTPDGRRVYHVGFAVVGQIRRIAQAVIQLERNYLVSGEIQKIKVG